MTKNRLVLSDAAVADIVEQADWYSTQSGKALAQRWEHAVKSAIMRTLNRLTLERPAISNPPNFMI